jgi:uncharacterized protein
MTRKLMGKGRGGLYMKKLYLWLLLIVLIPGLLPLNACSGKTTTAATSQTVISTNTTTTTTAATSQTVISTTTTTAATSQTVTSTTTTTAATSQTITPSATSTVTISLEETGTAWVNLLIAGQFSQAVKSFDKTMTGLVTAEALQQIWESIAMQYGAFSGITGVRTAKQDGYDQVYVTCKFANVEGDLLLTYDTERKLAGLHFLPSSNTNQYSIPDYANTDAFLETEVTVGTGQWKLPATLAMPKGEGPFPAVVLVHGSGANDRDETVEGNKPFKDIAWGLASRGIAVLRYEKRTKQYPNECAAMIETFTVEEETISDALAAADLLSQTKGINTGKIFVLGHSLGGMLAPRIAAENGRITGRISGLVILAGPSRKLEDLVLEQITYLVSIDGITDDNDTNLIKDTEQQVQQIKTLDIKPGETIMGGALAYWQDLDGYNQTATAQTLTIPMLILQGERDYQVTMVDFKGWSDALQGKAGVTLKSYVDLNHLFMTGSGKSVPSEYSQPGNVARTVIEDIAVWVTSL